MPTTTLQNVKDIDIKNNVSQEVHPSTCAGAVHFHRIHAQADSFGLASLNGTGCTTTQTRPFALITTVGHSGGALTLTAYPFPNDPSFADLFVATGGTNLNSHSPDLGQQWQSMSPAGSENWKINPSGEIYCSNLASDGQALIAGKSKPSSGNHWSHIRIHCVTTSARIGVFVRGVDRDNYYRGVHIPTNTLRIIKRVSGTETILGSATLTIAAGDVEDLDLIANGSSLVLQIGGVSKVSVSDSALTGSADCGVFTTQIASQTTGLHGLQFAHGNV